MELFISHYSVCLLRLAYFMAFYHSINYKVSWRETHHSCLELQTLFMVLRTECYTIIFLRFSFFDKYRKNVGSMIFDILIIDNGI